MTIAAQKIAEQGLHAGAAQDGCVALVEEVSAVHARFVGGEITSSSQTQHRRLTLGMVRGMNVGVATRTGVDSLASIRATAEAACAAGTPVADQPQLVPRHEGATSDEWSKPPGDVEADVLSNLAERLSNLRETDPSTRLHGFGEERICTSYLATSEGLRLRHEQSCGVLDLTHSPLDGASASWVGARAESLSSVSADALQPVTRLRGDTTLGRAPLQPGSHEVLLSPCCMADLMHHLYNALGAQEALSGRGPFATAQGGPALGDTLARHVPLTLRSNPQDPQLSCPPFLIARGTDQRTSVLDNGLALHATRWIEDGALAALVHTRATAHRSGKAPTAAINNLTLESSEAAAGGIEGLIARTRRGILVNSLWYLRPVDRQRLVLTGLTRDGVYLIEQGEITAELPDFRFNVSPLELLGRICEVSNTVPTLPREYSWVPWLMGMPAVRVEAFDVTAVSR